MSQTPSVDEPVIYDSARNSRLCYDEGVAALRERLERSKVVIGDCTLYNEDCRFILPTLRGIDAVVTDPPYGIGWDRQAEKDSGRKPGVAMAAKRHYVSTDWDEKPIDPDLLDAVRMAGKWQIIFGGNYYALPPARCWLVWDKQVNGEFADCELAWTNLDKVVKRIQYRWNGFLRQNGEPRGDHPTQKPIGVMRWCIQKLPADVRTILDPFAGSGTTGVASVLEGKSFIGIEHEKRYFDAMCRRIEDAYRDPEALARYVA